MKLFDSKFLGRRPSIESSQQSQVNRHYLSSVSQQSAARNNPISTTSSSAQHRSLSSSNFKAFVSKSCTTSSQDSSSSVVALSCSNHNNSNPSGHVVVEGSTKIDEDDINSSPSPPLPYSASSSSSHLRQLVIVNRCDVMRGGRGAVTSLINGGPSVAGRPDRLRRRRLAPQPHTSRLNNQGPRPILLSNMLLFAFVLICYVGVQPIAALQYDIWFKYPHPYTKVDPVQYCKEDIATPDCRSQMPVYTNTLDSEKTLIPYTYNQFDFCPSVEANTYEYSAREYNFSQSLCITVMTRVNHDSIW